MVSSAQSENPCTIIGSCFSCMSLCYSAQKSALEMMHDDEAASRHMIPFFRNGRQPQNDCMYTLFFGPRSSQHTSVHHMNIDPGRCFYLFRPQPFHRTSFKTYPFFFIYFCFPHSLTLSVSLSLSLMSTAEGSACVIKRLTIHLGEGASP